MGDGDIRAGDSPSGRLKELDGWRAVSVLAVLVYHVTSFQHPRFLTAHPHLHGVVAHGGLLGVKVFFVISGFVICRLLLREEQRFGAISLRGFYLRRAFRILPPFAAYLAAVAILRLLGWIDQPWSAFFAAAAFLYDLNLFPPSWFVGHTWSLAIEEQFYLILPSLWLLTRKPWRVHVFPALFVFLVAWNIAAVFTGPSLIVPAVTRQGFACICWGVLMAIFESRARRIGAAVPGWIVALAAAVLLVRPVRTGGLAESLYEPLFVAPAIGLLLAHSLEHRGWLHSLLCSRPMQAAGLTSYGIYLWQQLFTAPKFDYASPSGRILGYLLPLLLVLIPLSYFFLEKPAIRLGRTLAGKSTRRAPGATA